MGEPCFAALTPEIHDSKQSCKGAFALNTTTNLPNFYAPEPTPSVTLRRA
jgi:hypothetical protein